MDPRYDVPRRAASGGGGSASSSPAFGAQSRRRKMPPRPADFKLQIIIIGSRGVGKTSLMERFTDDTFCEACKSTVGEVRRRFTALILSSFLLTALSGAVSTCWREGGGDLKLLGLETVCGRLYRLMGLDTGYPTGCG